MSGTSTGVADDHLGHEGEVGTMSHRQILTAMSGLLVGMFVAMLSSTVVANALPRIIGDLHGSEAGYTWVVAATLLTMTATTPIWGKLSDLFDPKTLVQLSLLIYVGGSAVAGLSQSVLMLIAARAIQGAGAGGLMALVQVVMARMIAPRERGRYSGYLGAVFALATVLGPLAGGVIVDTSWLGWRWCFYIGVPFAVLAIVVLQRTLRLPVDRHPVKIDYLGATLLVGAVSIVLVWVSLAGKQFAWASVWSVTLVATGLMLLALALVVESRVAEPILPLGLFRDRTVALASIASVFVGSALYGVTVFLSQYFQVARLKTPTMSGLYTIPLVLGMFLSSLLVGRIITYTGKWKIFLVTGSLTLVAGFAVLATVRSDTAYAVLAIGMFLAGTGMGATMQNLVLAVQNSVSIKQIGSASAAVSFLRSLGGAIGVSALGAVLSTQVAGHVRTGLSHLGASAASDTGSGVADPAHLPAPVATVVEQAYGIGTGWVFGISALAALLGALVIPFIRETPLRTSSVDPEDPLVSAAITVAEFAGDFVEDDAPGGRELARV
jgi:EmrB/QacA subfamily drug resistance transporter